MSRKNCMIGYLLSGVLLMTVAHAAAAKPIQITTMFCVSGSDGSWTIQQYKPLINPHANALFAEMSSAGTRLLEFKLERFSEDAGVTFDYKFDETGQLNALVGTVRVTGSWLGRANLMPDSDGSMAPPRIQFYKDNVLIMKPEDAGDYIHLLDAPPIYRTTDAVPCAAMKNQTVRMNATQE